MKKYCLYIIGLLLGASSCEFSSKPSLPAFNMLLLDSTTVFNTINVPKGKPIVLFFFSPDCTHCQKETEQIIKEKGIIENASLVYISVDTLDKIRTFYNHYKMRQYPSIIMGKDYKYFIFQYYKPPTTPFVVIYDKEKQLCESFQGEIEPGKLVTAIKSHERSN